GANPSDFDNVIDQASLLADPRCTFQFDEFLNDGSDASHAKGLKGQFSDELVLSADYEPFESWVFGVGAVYRTLGSVIEDMSTDGGNTYFIGNPDYYDTNARDDLLREILNTTDPAERAKLELLLRQMPTTHNFPTPTRKNLSVRFQVDKKFSNHFAIVGSY